MIIEIVLPLLYAQILHSHENSLSRLFLFLIDLFSDLFADVAQDFLKQVLKVTGLGDLLESHLFQGSGVSYQIFDFRS